MNAVAETGDNGVEDNHGGCISLSSFLRYGARE